MKFNTLRTNSNQLPYIVLTFAAFIFLFTACEKNESVNETVSEKLKTTESIELDAKFIFNQIEDQEKNETITVDLRHIKQNWVFYMHKNDMDNADSKAIEVQNGLEQIVELEKAFFLYGKDKVGRPSLIVSRASGFYLEFLDNERLKIVEALSDHNLTAKNNQYIIYTSDDLVIEDKHLYQCQDLPTPNDSKKLAQANGAAKMVHANRFLDVTCVADLGFRDKIGDSLDAFDEMFDILFLGGARFWFYSDYNLKPRMKDVYIFYNPIIPAQATAEEALTAWRSNFVINDEDAAVLFTDRLLSNPAVPGFVQGVASKGVVCSKSYKSHAYNAFYPHDFVRHQIFAHELAHLFNAEHQKQSGPMEANILDATSVNFYWEAEYQMDIYLEDDANEACLLD